MEKTLMVLDKINTPEDLRGLSAEEMNLLSAEIRDLILKKVNTTGGHLGPNLGMVEAQLHFTGCLILLLINSYLMFLTSVIRIKF